MADDLSPDFVDDNQALPLMEALMAAAVAENDKRHLPELGFKTYQFGQNPVIDHAGPDSDGCAEITVWISNAFAIAEGGFPDPALRAVCSTEMAFELNVGVFRCVEVEDTRTGIPSEDEQFRATRIALADMASLKNAIRCWLQGKREYNLGAYTQFNQGFVIGGAWTVLVGGKI